MNINLSMIFRDKHHLFFLSSSLLLLLVISSLFGTIFYMAYPAVSSTGMIEFVFGSKWSYSEGVYGIWTFIAGTFIMTLTTMCMAVPLGLFTAIYLAEFAHPRLRGIMKSSIELLVGIPSVVYGIFGLFILKAYMRDYVNPLISSTLGSITPVFYDASGSGDGVLLASVILTVMIIPTIISISEDSLRSVSRSYREGSVALGSTKWETIQKIVVPTAMPGILAGITLGMTRALGETMAIVMLLGNSMHMPSSVFDSGYAMTSKILNDITYYFANPAACSALFGIAAALIVIEAIFILFVRIIGQGVKNA
ncbi:MAG: phosphate ABC transporter permease subunit PstC [Candidatus Altiarchaeota archaeon]|nr:phosphate ABC transporter permease subunit PstC [Candidatus Altiarchaeota archaeon]